MENKKKYTVSDLAEQLNVARTTINDWLTRYSQYIDYKIQGKRKIYFDSSLNVLKEISELRNSGLSSFDIEEELVKRHPVHAEVDPGKKDDNPDEQQDRNFTEEYAVIVKKQTDEVGKLISDQLQQILHRIGGIEDYNNHASSNASRWFTFAIIMFFLIVIISASAAFKIYSMQKINEKLLSDKAKINLDKKDIDLKLNEKTIRLEKVNEDKNRLENNSRDLKNNLTNMGKQLQEREKNLKTQEKEFKIMLEKARKEEKMAKEAEILALRDKFAADRLKLLKDIEAYSQKKRQNEELLKNFQDNNFKQNKMLNDLVSQNKKLTREKEQLLKLLEEQKILLQKSAEKNKVPEKTDTLKKKNDVKKTAKTRPKTGDIKAAKDKKKNDVKKTAKKQKVDDKKVAGGKKKNDVKKTAKTKPKTGDIKAAKDKKKNDIKKTAENTQNTEKSSKK